MSRASTFRMLVLALLWGSGFFFIAIALRGLSAVQLTLARLALGAVVLVPFVIARYGRLPSGQRLWAHLTVAAILANAIPYTLFAFAETEVPSSTAGVINSTTPLWALLFDLVAGGQRPSRTRLVGLVIGFVGTIIIFAPWRASSPIALWGGLASLLASASYGVSYVYQHRYLTGRGQSSLVLSTGQLIAATGLLALLVPVAGLQPIHVRVDVLAAVFVLGALGTGTAYVLNYRLIADEGPAASIVTYLIPVVAVLLGVLGLGEPVTVPMLAGVAIVLLGVALSQR